MVNNHLPLLLHTWFSRLLPVGVPVEFDFRTSRDAAEWLVPSRGPDYERMQVTNPMMSFIREDEGQGLVEYALIIAVIAIAVIVAMIFLRGQIQNIFSNIGNNLT